VPHRGPSLPPLLSALHPLLQEGTKSWQGIGPIVPKLFVQLFCLPRPQALICLGLENVIRHLDTCWAQTRAKTGQDRKLS
jgi:hypothetical protein